MKSGLQANPNVLLFCWCQLAFVGYVLTLLDPCDIRDDPEDTRKREIGEIKID